MHYRNLGILLGLGIILSGCATGRGEFRIIKTTPVPAMKVMASPTPAGVTSDSGPVPASPGAEEKTTYEVLPGDSLWRISRRLWGRGDGYKRIVEQNRIANPDIIHPGQILILKPEGQATPRLKARTDRAGKPLGKSAKPKPVGSSAADRPLFPNRPNQAFRPGEKLSFSVEYFGIAAGFATLAVYKGPEMYGRPTYHLKATARTHPAFEWVFKVRDRIESYFDARGLFSWRYEKHIREGSYSNDSEIVYDQFKQQVIKDQGRTILPAPPLTQDVLSEFYFFRTLDVKIGDEINIPVVADNGKTYELLVKILRREKKTVPAGTFDCLVVEPYLKFEGLFKHQGKLHIWLTDDKRKVPVLIKSKIVIGSINIVLRNAQVVDVE